MFAIDALPNTNGRLMNARRNTETKRQLLAELRKFLAFMQHQTCLVSVRTGVLKKQVAACHSTHRVQEDGYVHPTIDDAVGSQPLHVVKLVILLSEEQQRGLATL